MSILIEIAVDTLHDAIAAERGGADRIELCSDLEADGLSPSLELVRETRKALSIPIHAMVRPRSGDFCYSEDEFLQMKKEIAEFKSLGVNGIVLGILKNDRSVDGKRTEELVQLADPLGVTFHRAFDVSLDPITSLDEIIYTGAVRLLTSGQNETAIEGIATIQKLIAHARGRIMIMPGAGIRIDNIHPLLKRMNIQEVHLGKGVKDRNSEGRWEVHPERMKELADVLSQS